MMKNYPFYANQFTYPQYSSPAPLPPRKVVTIPVSGGSERPLPLPNKSDSAVKIQKVFRGFLVRKSVRKICEIRNEVNEIEKLLAAEEKVELMRNDSKERLKMSEMIMRLLLRLDSVRGVDCGVRDLRKTVIKKAIRLQEIVDSVTLNSNNNNNLIGDDQTADAQRQEEEEVINGVDFNSDSVEKNAEPEIMETSQADLSEEINELSVVADCDGDGDAEKEEADATVEAESGGRRSGELMEKMKEDNEKMMELMGKLFERNEMQTRLLSSLSQRVEQLERVLICERTKRNKKKKRNSGGVSDCFESNQNCKRTGKR